jgi:hypothetical protein
LTCGENGKVNPSSEANPISNSNNVYSNDVKDFVMVQPEKENPIPSLPAESRKVRFLLPVRQELCSVTQMAYHPTGAHSHKSRSIAGPPGSPAHGTGTTGNTH